MILTLLSHQWKSFWRSRSAGKSLAVQLFIGFILLYVLASALVLGFTLKHILREIFRHSDPIAVFCGFIFYYFSFDLLLRFMTQELPVLAIQPYLVQNIHRRQLVNFLNIRSLFHFLNLTPLLTFLPFIFTDLASARGIAAAWALAATILFLTLFNNFLLLYLKRRSIINSWWMVGFFSIIVALMTLDYFHTLSILQFSSQAFASLLAHPWLVLLPALLAALAYLNNYRFLFRNLYLEDLAKGGKAARSREYAWLNQWGPAGELIALNFKLIARNKRPKYLIRFSVIMLFYGFVFYTQQNIRSQHTIMIFLGALFITGSFITNFGQFLFSWHSSYFQGLMASAFSIRHFIRAQFLLFMAIATVSFALSLFYGFMSWKILPIEVAAWLYNIGVNTVVCIYFSNFNTKPIDLDRTVMFNYQGTSLSQWIFALVSMLLPILLYLLLERCIGFWPTVISFGTLGLISLLLYGWWIDVLAGTFQRRKYIMLEGFRER